MLTKPLLADEEIARCLQNAYSLTADKISFLPLGADFNTIVYKVTTTDNIDYFLKLRRSNFDEASVLIPKYLFESGLKQIIPPIVTNEGKLWTSLVDFKVILYPYVDGQNALDTHLSDKQWCQLGETVKKIHSIKLPDALLSRLRREDFLSKWPEKLQQFLVRIETEIFQEELAAELVLLLQAKKTEILYILKRTEKLENLLRKQSLNYGLCHADIHGWNLLIDNNKRLFLVDWDTLIFAPKERDLMFIGAGIWNSGITPLEEEALFYQGYGQTDVNLMAVSYYRYVRIIEDISVYCEYIFQSDKGDDDRMQSFEYLRSNFLSNGTIDMAHQADR